MTYQVNIGKDDRKKKSFFPVILIIIVSFTLLYYFYTKTVSNDKEAEISSVLSDTFSEDSYPSVDDLAAIPLESKRSSLIAVGDFLLDRNVGRAMKERNDYHFPIKNTKYILESADITFCNVECPVCEGREIGITERSFRADPETIQALTYGGFDVVSLANNHTMNFGGDCLVKTFDYLNEAGIDYVGAGSNFKDSHKPLIKEVNGIRIAFLAYNDSDVVPSFYFASEDSPGTNLMDTNQLKKDIDKLKSGKYEDIDLIIVSMHSGTEYTPIPNQRQVSFAHAAIDYGADIILGHHPHHTQHIEQYKGKYIIYSMGNFVLDQMSCNDCTKELLLVLTLSKEKVNEVEIIPIRQKNFCETNVAVGYEKEEILQIINFDTEQKPYIRYQNGRYETGQRDVLVDNSNSKKTNSTSIEQKRMIWEIEKDMSLNAALFENYLYIFDESSIIWVSDVNWDVWDFEIGKLDGERGMLVISYTKESESTGWISVLDYKNQEIQILFEQQIPEIEAFTFETADLNGDEKDEIAVLSRKYDDLIANKTSKGTVSVWHYKSGKWINDFEDEGKKIEDIWIIRDMIYLDI